MAVCRSDRRRQRVKRLSVSTAAKTTGGVGCKVGPCGEADVRAFQELASFMMQLAAGAWGEDDCQPGQLTGGPGEGKLSRNRR
jgi:hypothetical protein